MNRTWRVGVIGRTGRGDYGHGLDAVWQKIDGVQVVAVADDNKAGLAAMAAKLNVQQAFADYRKMLDDVQLDIVAICPRWLDQHREMVVAAAQRGIHVYMEKPFCRTLQEADEMVAACERTHARLAIAHQTRYSPKLKVVQDLIAAGKIGTVLEYRGRGKEDARGGGEDLWVLGSHVLNLIAACGGAPKWCFGVVNQVGRSAQPTDVADGPEGIGPLVGDAVQAVYGLENGVTGYFGSTRNAGGGARFGLQILGSAGVLEIQTGYLPSVKFLDDPTWSPGRSNAAWQNVTSQGIGTEEPLPDGGADAGNQLAVKDLLAAIEENRQPLCNMYEARTTIEMIAAVFASHVQKAPVTLPLADRRNPLAP